MTAKIEDTLEAWESGALGKDPAFAVPLSAEEEASDRALIDQAMGLKAISIRLEIELIEGLKAIAKHYEMGYQPLMRQALHRFVDNELKLIALGAMDKSEEKEVKVGCPALQAALPKAA
jgi:hypothetical protein